jgi:hypothetical protein
MTQKVFPDCEGRTHVDRHALFGSFQLGDMLDGTTRVSHIDR